MLICLFFFIEQKLLEDEAYEVCALPLPGHCGP